MTLYNLTGLQTATNTADLITYANNSTQGVLVGFFMVSIFFILLLAFKRYDFEDALITASFLCFLPSTVLAYIGWLNILFPLAFLIITAFTGLYIYATK